MTTPAPEEKTHAIEQSEIVDSAEASSQRGEDASDLLAPYTFRETFLEIGSAVPVALATALSASAGYVAAFPAGRNPDYGNSIAIITSYIGNGQALLYVTMNGMMLVSQETYRTLPELYQAGQIYALGCGTLMNGLTLMFAFAVAPYAYHEDIARHTQTFALISIPTAYFRLSSNVNRVIALRTHDMLLMLSIDLFSTGVAISFAAKKISDGEYDPAAYAEFLLIQSATSAFLYLPRLYMMQNQNRFFMRSSLESLGHIVRDIFVKGGKIGLGILPFVLTEMGVGYATSSHRIQDTEVFQNMFLLIAFCFAHNAYIEGQEGFFIEKNPRRANFYAVLAAGTCNLIIPVVQTALVLGLGDNFYTLITGDDNEEVRDNFKNTILWGLLVEYFDCFLLSPAIAALRGFNDFAYPIAVTSVSYGLFLTGNAVLYRIFDWNVSSFYQSWLPSIFISAGILFKRIYTKMTEARQTSRVVIEEEAEMASASAPSVAGDVSSINAASPTGVQSPQSFSSYSTMRLMGQESPVDKAIVSPNDGSSRGWKIFSYCRSFFCCGRKRKIGTTHQLAVSASQEPNSTILLSARK